MTRKLTLFLVCAFEIALILFVVAWKAFANTENLYACGQWTLRNEGVKIQEAVRAKFPQRMGKNFILTDDDGNLTITTHHGKKKQIGKIGTHNEVIDIYQTLSPTERGDHSLYFVSEWYNTITIETIHPLAALEYTTTCQK